VRIEVATERNAASRTGRRTARVRRYAVRQIASCRCLRNLVAIGSQRTSIIYDYAPLVRLARLQTPDRTLADSYQPTFDASTTTLVLIVTRS